MYHVGLGLMVGSVKTVGLFRDRKTFHRIISVMPDESG